MKTTIFFKSMFFGMVSMTVISLVGLCSTAHAQEGECSDGLCGTPDESGGGGGGGGSVLIANTDEGETYQYADDYDEDGFEDDFDNCPWHENPAQLDRDTDGWGDRCDTCFDTWNPNQFDRDRDGLGDWCDPDLDGDGIQQQPDNCPSLYNPSQLDTDADGIGDICDSDDDDDGIPDIIDECPLLHRRNYRRSMVCVNDDDLDTVYDHVDNCVVMYNPSQLDTDQDGVGDRCDVDADGNGLADRAEHKPIDFKTADDPATVISDQGCALVKINLSQLNFWRRR